MCSSRAQSWNRRGLPTMARLTGGGVATGMHQALPASDLVLRTPQSTHNVTCVSHTLFPFWVDHVGRKQGYPALALALALALATAQPTLVGRLPAPPAVQGDTGDPVSLVAGGTRGGG